MSKDNGQKTELKGNEHFSTIIKEARGVLHLLAAAQDADPGLLDQDSLQVLLINTADKLREIEEAI